MDDTIDVDCLIIGTGFSGIYQLYSCLHASPPLSVLCIDRAHGVGGTWFWNRYPGAMSDTEAYVYRFSWDRDDLTAFHYPDHYAKQPQVVAYLEHIVQRHGLAPHIQLGTELVGAEWDGGLAGWRCEVRRTGEDGKLVENQESRTIRARWLITALGLLSKQKLPDIPGMERFKGRTVHSGTWPKDLDVTNDRVGIIGNGSTGVQIITALAPKVKRLVSFQRSPQYSVPSGDRPVSKEYREWISSSYDDIWHRVRNSVFGFGFEEPNVAAMSVSEEERRRKFQESWDMGNGLRFMLGTFSDIIVDRRANDEAANFIKEKIRETVKDPEKARRLMPREIYARRPLCDAGYYESFNYDTVDIVNLRDTPITEMTEKGIVTSDGVEYELDTIIYATGFDAVEGSYSRVRIKGRSGKTLKDHWEELGPTSYLGMCCSDFPNLFLISGPQGPFTNNPPAIERQVEWITETMSAFRQRGRRAVVEASAEAENGWNEQCMKIAQNSLFHEIPSWIFGANIEGKKYATRFYFGGLMNWSQELDEVAKDDYRGFVKQDAGPAQGGEETRSML